MFNEIDNDDVQLMLTLSRENPGNSSRLKSQLINIDMHKFFHLCQAHELEGVVASHILTNDLCALPNYWLEKYQKEKERLTFFRDKSIEICELMYQNGIAMSILKNGGIMIDMVTDPAACPMEDIDSLVEKKDFLKVHELLLQGGFAFKFRSEYESEELERAFQDGSTEYCIQAPDKSKMWFELAWRAVAGRWMRQDLEPNTDELLANSYFADGTHVAILSPEDNLMQVSIHTAKHSYVRAPGLRLHLDVERIIAHKKINWNLFLEKVSTAHVKRAVYFSLYFAHYLFDTPIPAYVMSALKPSHHIEQRTLRFIDAAGLLNPHDKKFSKLKFLRFQSSLYDSKIDMLRVIYPRNGRLKEIYGYTSSVFTPFYIMKRLFDLLGIRKKK